ncbi:MAG: hypothetical protein U1C46_01910 [Bacteroidales bacterium]|nr:hypothetical protein [Bacteroidales bacterium]MDZ4203550.1 hypothetical protein [Bacteroidales bacterium]
MSGNYQLAAEEYERLVFISEASNPIILRLIQSYRLNNQPLLALHRMKSLWNEPGEIDAGVAKEYFSLEIINGNYDELLNETKLNKQLSTADMAFFEASILLIKEQYGPAKSVIERIDFNQSPVLRSYHAIGSDAMGMKLKNPWVSGSMSAVIPGSGKIYTGEWQDGLIAMAIIGTSLWQSYRGFNKNGIESSLGWIMGAVGVGFYAGNIYGSVKSANKYNSQKKNIIKLRVQANFYNHL